jgi:hypothetical protein
MVMLKLITSEIMKYGCVEKKVESQNWSRQAQTTEMNLGQALNLALKAPTLDL